MWEMIIGLEEYLHRVKKAHFDNKAPIRMCSCGHEPYLHKGWQFDCVVSGCGCKALKEQSRNKFFSQRAEYKGTSYQSKFERDYAFGLDMRLKAGEIKDIQRQRPIPLFVYGKKITTYIADFLVTHLDGSQEIIETKGFFSDYSKLKWKLFEAIFTEEHPEMKITMVRSS